MRPLNRPNGLDPSVFFKFAHDFQPLAANHRFNLKFGNATLNTVVLNILFYRYNR